MIIYTLLVIEILLRDNNFAIGSRLNRNMKQFMCGLSTYEHKKQYNFFKQIKF